MPKVSARPPLNVETYCCASTRRSYDGATDNCHRGPGRNENDPASRRSIPPSAFWAAPADPVQRVCAVALFPKLPFNVQPCGVAISGPPRVSLASVVRKRRLNVTADVQKFSQVTFTVEPT